MARKKTGRRRGRPRKINARRRMTTREGRRTGLDPRDDGTAPLRARKKHFGRPDVELTAAGLLFARGHLDAQQYDALGMVTHWLQCLGRALGPRNFGIDGLWENLTGAMISPPGPMVPSGVRGNADHARYMLGRLLRRLNGSRDLVVALAEGRLVPLVERVALRALTIDDTVELDRLREGLDAIAGGRRIISARG